MENEDLGKCIDDCMKILDENVGVLSDMQFDLNKQKEDELVPSMQLTDLIDMTQDVADSSRLKKAEFSLIQRYLEK
jgi:hypothetical protein